MRAKVAMVFFMLYLPDLVGLTALMYFSLVGTVLWCQTEKGVLRKYFERCLGEFIRRVSLRCSV